MSTYSIDFAGSQSDTNRMFEPTFAAMNANAGFKSQDNDNDKICRICHGGEDEGKLFSPCKCKGSIKYVHVTCLDQWRKTTQNKNNYFQCENCHYKYNFKRASLSQLLASTAVLHATTLIILLLLIVLSGYAWKLFEYFFVEEKDRSWSSFFWIDLFHLMSGTVIMGFLGFFQLLFMARISPIFHGIHGGGGGGRNSVEVVILCILIGIGLIKMFITLYGIVKERTGAMLTHVEDMILEVHED